MNYSELDTIFNTGLWKQMFLEILMSLVMPYPFLYEKTYSEDANAFSVGLLFEWNDFLLCFMIFCRLPYLIRTILSNSKFADPRAQRVCGIYGCDANQEFAIKALMIESPKEVLAGSLVISLIMFSY
jgi:potassium intermediate/small conductance calcium-activated channel subfamily N protein 2